MYSAHISVLMAVNLCMVLLVSDRCMLWLPVLEAGTEDAHACKHHTYHSHSLV